MTVSQTIAVSDAGDAFRDWLQAFGRVLENQSVDALMAMFSAEAHWKDILAFTWEHRTFSGPSEIRAAFEATLESAAPRSVRVSEGRTPPRRLRRSGREVVEAYFDFDSRIGRGTAFVRLVPDKSGPGGLKVWLLLTTLQELRGFEEKTGKNRPTGNEFAMNALGRSWREDRQKRRSYADRDPQVIVMGAGQAGLSIAARLGQMGVDALVVERSERIGDVWRERYESLTLHNETMANHLPYMPFPDTWPLWLSKDQLAGWLEGYAEAMEINVWTGTTIKGAVYDEAKASWRVSLHRTDGSVREMHCRHLVLACGASGGLPQMADISGLSAFKGEVLHSRDFRNGANHQGQRVVVVGTGNSGHDIAQDLVVKGAQKVWMLQRGPTCVASLEPTAAMVYKIYGEGIPTEDVDLITASLPYPLLEETYRWITQKGAELDREMLDSLNRVGFKTYFGSDGTGFQMKFMRGEGGYYIDVGNCALIADGRVGIIQYDDTAELVENGFRMQDGSVIEFDALIMATGFKNMQETIRLYLGDVIADRIGPVWGFDEHFQMRNMWRRTAQPGLWITGGSLLDSRLYSRFLALELCAELNGLLPEKAALPLAKH